MGKIDVTDEAIINAPQNVVFNGIIDCYSGNAPWWEPHFYARYVGGNKPGSVGSTVELQVPHRARFIARIDKIEAPSNIWVSFIDGTFRGTGFWTFKSEGNATRVSLRWQPEIVPLWMRGFSKIVQKNHSRVMHIGFAALDKYLNGKSK